MYRKGPGGQEELSPGVWNPVQWAGRESASVSSQQPWVCLWKHIRPGGGGEREYRWTFHFCLVVQCLNHRYFSNKFYFLGFCTILGPQWIFCPVLRRPHFSHPGLLCATPQTGRGSQHPHKVPGLYFSCWPLIFTYALFGICRFLCHIKHILLQIRC